MLEDLPQSDCWMIHILHVLFRDFDAYFFCDISSPNLLSVISNDDTKSNKEKPLEDNDKLIEAALFLKILPCFPYESCKLILLCLDTIRFRRRLLTGFSPSFNCDL